MLMMKPITDGDWSRLRVIQRTRFSRSCQTLQARSSVGERFLDTEEVGSSILPVPTIS